MPKTYKISAENAIEIEEIRKTITDKKVDRRLHAVQLRGEGLTNHEIAEKLDTSDKMVSQWVSAYINDGGIEATSFPRSESECIEILVSKKKKNFFQHTPNKPKQVKS